MKVVIAITILLVCITGSDALVLTWEQVNQEIVLGYIVQAHGFFLDEWHSRVIWGGEVTEIYIPPEFIDRHFLIIFWVQSFNEYMFTPYSEPLIYIPAFEPEY